MSRQGMFVRSLRQRPEKFFLVVGAIFGVLFVFLIPPIQTPDEKDHFLRVYQISQFHAVSQYRQGVLGDDLPESLLKMFNVVDSPTLEFSPQLKYDIHSTVAASRMNLAKNEASYTTIASTSAYSPAGYIPQAVVVGFASLFNTPPVSLLYLARLASLGTWLGLVYAAIRVIPYRKWTVAGLALLPTLMNQAVSPGVDAVSIGLGVLYVALILRFRQDGSVPQRTWILLMLLGAVAALTKQTTLLVVGFACLIPAASFGSSPRRNLFKKAALFIVPLAAIGAWSALAGLLHLNAASVVPHQDLHGQLSALVHDPFRFPAVIFQTFFLTWGDNVVTSFAGSFGWADAPLSEGVVIAVFVYIAYLLLRSYEQRREGRGRTVAVVTTVLVALYVLGTMAALYLLYSPVNFPIIYGLQGRYFTLALFMALPLCALLAKTTDIRQYSRVVKVMAPLLLACTALTIYLRFYVKLF